MEKLAYCPKCKKTFNYSVALTIPEYCQFCLIPSKLTVPENYMKKTCKQCGGTFTQNIHGPIQHYCSTRCRMRHYRYMIRTGTFIEDPPDTLTCKQCGKPLTIKSTGRKPRFCSGRCQTAYWRKTHISKNP
jgi:endogenous inhibitor of DNA gyrase (YacG/DUF329 family)